MEQREGGALTWPSAGELGPVASSMEVASLEGGDEFLSLPGRACRAPKPKHISHHKAQRDGVVRICC